MNQKEKEDSELKNAKIDSAVVLTQKREDITNAKLDLEYKRIDLEQSKYEAGAQQRKTKMEFQKAQIELERKKRDFLLEKNKQKINVSRREQRVEELDRLIKKYQLALRSTQIVSPGDGVVMFAKDWMGKKLTKDSEVGMWAPLIATLPDMSVAISEAYVKEIDIAKIHTGDSVRITIDALPDKQFSGHIYHIATIGEDHKNFDMKVFRVMIRFVHSDKDLMPGMTCKNDIISSKNDNALLVPLEAVFSENHGNFVYLKKGEKIFRQSIKTGSEDETNTVVLEGLEEGDQVLLYKPEPGLVVNL
jgi:RND family efflux transporter MFP subunit